MNKKEGEYMRTIGGRVLVAFGFLALLAVGGAVAGPGIPAPCDTGEDATSGDDWVVCRADANSAWLSHNQPSGGTYDAEAICQSLGYSGVSQNGGNCGDVCGFCQAETTSCSSPGAENYDTQNSCAPGTLCFTVTWLCGEGGAGPTPTVAPPVAPEIPTLGGAGLVALTLALLAAVGVLLRRAR